MWAPLFCFFLTVSEVGTPYCKWFPWQLCFISKHNFISLYYMKLWVLPRLCCTLQKIEIHQPLLLFLLASQLVIHDGAYNRRAYFHFYFIFHSNNQFMLRLNVRQAKQSILCLKGEKFTLTFILEAHFISLLSLH